MQGDHRGGQRSVVELRRMEAGAQVLRQVAERAAQHVVAPAQVRTQLALAGLVLLLGLTVLGAARRRRQS